MSDLADRVRTTAPDLAARYRADGHWDDGTLGALVAHRVAAHPRLPVRIWSDDRPHYSDARTLFDQAQRLAGALRSNGIRPGDVVAYQLPNWAETLTTLWGGALAGVVLVPIVHFYGPNEVRFILRQSEARAIITVDRWGGTDQLENLEALRTDLDSLELVAVVPANGSTPLPEHSMPWSILLEADPVEAPEKVDPDHPAVIAYTSGTTAEPKGVMHSHRTLLAELRQQSGASFSRDRPMLNSSPLAHMAGMLGGALQPLFRGEEIHLIDRWDPTRVLDIVERERIRPGGGPPIYLTSLLDHPRFRAAHRELMTIFGMGGAPIPSAVAERAEAEGIRPWPIYGSTEHPTITQAAPDDPPDVRTHTCGRPRPGVEVRLIDDEGGAVAPGEPGEILSRGPDLFCGYTDPTLTARAVDAEGWYHTGDVGVFDERDNLSITDRLGDLIIRGGRNISGVEIETHVLRHPSVAEAAVIAAPHPTLGETACAVLRLRNSAAQPTIAEIQRQLDALGVPKQKWPESIRIVDDFPRTPTGKIRKHVLRADLGDL